MKNLIRKVLKRIKTIASSQKRVEKVENLFLDIEEKEFWEIYNLCSPYSMTSVERMYCLYKSVDYLLSNNIEGDFVECGVWRGGSAMMIAKMLSNRKIVDRKLFLYDTFEGMTEPTDSDVRYNGENATILYNELVDENGKTIWCVGNLEDVKRNLDLTNFDNENIVYVKGKVEDTIPNNLPENKISLLRLDTDWYESTKHELIHLFPILETNGVLIIDDYGYWRGSRKAVDEYFNEIKLPAFLNRIDNTGRILIKNIN
jgi:O-methyltransferase